MTNARVPGSIIGLVAIMLLAGVLRFHDLGRESLWLDEAVSVAFANDSITGLVHDTATDVHPPLYYLVLHAWVKAAGDSERAVRALSVIFSLMVVLGTWVLANRWFDGETAVIASLLVAIAPLQIRFAQEARMYALLACLSAISLEAWLTTVLRGGRWPFIRFVLATAGMLYTHAYGMFVVAGELMWLGATIAMSRDDLAGRWRRGLLAMALVVIGFLPWLSTEIVQVRSVEQGFWISDQTTLADAARTHAGSAVLAWVMVGLVILGFARLQEPPGPPSRLRFGAPADNGGAKAPPLLLVLTLLCVVGIPYLASRVSTPIFLAKYTVAGSVAFLLLVARGVTGVPWRPVRAVLVIGLMTMTIGPLRTYYDTNRKDDWRGVSAYVDREAQPGDMIVFSRSFGQLPFDYYLRRTDLVELPFLDANDDLTSRSVDVLARVGVGPYDRVWLVTSLPDETTAAAERALAGYDDVEHETLGNVEAHLFVRRASEGGGKRY